MSDMAAGRGAIRGGGSLLSALAVQARVIGALILRELHTRYGRENIGYLWMVGEPMLLASVIGTIHAANGHTAYGSDVQPVPFGVLGYVTFILFRGIVNRSDGVLDSSTSLLHHRHVTMFDLLLARAMLEFCGTFLTLVVMMTILIGVGLAMPPARPLPLLAAWGFMWWYSFGHSLVVASITHDNKTFGRLVHSYTYFMMALSGAFIPLQWLGPTFRTILTWVPMASIFELVRYGWFESFTLDYFYPLYLTGACLVLTWTGLVLMAARRRHVHAG